MEYPDWFQNLWKNYPPRGGGNSKRAAYKACNARIRQGDKPEAIEQGLERYKAYCTHMGWIGTCYVKQASTFFGPDGHFEEEWEIPKDPTAPQPTGVTHASHRPYRPVDAGCRSTAETAMNALRSVRPR